jgi:hypothetical protein
MTDPLLSVIVICHDMPREAPRTLFSLSPAHQRGVHPEDYEIIAIDNGSGAPLDPAEVTSIAPNIRYTFHETASVSPVEALNLGGRMARGQHLAFIVDGARMASPGLVRATMDGIRLKKMPFLCSLSWHLGPDVQFNSMLEGYDQQVEDGLLDEIAWPQDGYRLFEISTLAPSSAPGFLGGFPSECSWLCLSRTGFERLGGYDPGFTSPGGGLVNQDIVCRAAEDGGFDFTVLLGEGVFHQFHGGVATNVKPAHHPMPAFQLEYERLRGTPYKRTQIEAVSYYGIMPQSARRFLAP